ncbi:ROK family protein [Brucepastera parasyntrophica]|uniref:ROK family protein n=1 Tax=Brucepastera parasyntrophica TaxID=2880008 RepID=UPI00210E6255|nr:ROK family protein [Brucepastera parasyntrophica]ULQ60309.1 ROK family protein [Brucepastera parasyntrophica]
MTGTNEQLRKMNTETIRDIFRSLKTATKSDISRRSGLSYATCSNVLNELSASGEILVLDEFKTESGRPAHQYRYNGDFARILCMFFTNEGQRPEVFFSVCNLEGEETERKNIRYRAFGYDEAEQLTASLLEKYPEIRCIALGIPGVVLKNRTIDICDIESLEQLEMADLLEKKFGVPVILENDMNLTALGFARQHGWESAVVMTFPEDNFPGSGLVADGRIIRGSSNFAGEISFLPYGFNRKKQRLLLKDPGEVPGFAAKAVSSIIAVLNPEVILLTGSLLGKEMLRDILHQCRQDIPREHMPGIHIESDISGYYFRGLFSMALDFASYPLQITEKKL